MTGETPALRFEDLTRTDLEALASESTLVVPLGSTEQHGRHLPVSTDTLIVTAIAARAVERAAPRIRALVVPTLPFGFAEHHLGFGGTVSLDASTYADVLVSIGRSADRQGFRRLVFLNGHGGNEGPLAFAVDRLAYQVAERLQLAAVSYWTLAAEELSELGLAAGLVPGHAGHFETSLLLVLAPELVDLDRRPPAEGQAMPIGIPEPSPAKVRRPGQWEASDGRTDDASLASRELGERALDAVADRVADFLVGFHREARSA